MTRIFAFAAAILLIGLCTVVGTYVALAAPL